MEKVSQYRNNAQECRRLAAIVQEREDRASLLLMAATWDTVANERLMILRPEKRDTAVKPSA
jgi:hypothetical protein